MAYVSDAYRTAIGKNLRRLREARGWTQEDLAGRIQLNRVRVSQFETGDLEGMPLSTLLRLTAALRVQVSDLLAPPVETRLRASMGALSKEEQAAVFNCFSTLEKEERQLYDHYYLDVDLSSADAPVRLAERHIRLHDLVLPPVDLDALLFAWGISKREVDLPDAVSGFLRRVTVGPFTRSILVVNKNHAPTRRRMTIAHELGHFWLDSAASFLDLDAAQAVAEQAETSAYKYGNALLMPPEWIARPKYLGLWQANPAAAAAAFNVSASAYERWAREQHLPLPPDPATKQLHDQVYRGASFRSNDKVDRRLR